MLEQSIFRGLSNDEIIEINTRVIPFKYGDETWFSRILNVRLPITDLI